jgi:hypothetical protein
MYIERVQHKILHETYERKRLEQLFDLFFNIYLDMYGNQDGSIPASYRVLYFIGWKPDPSQVRC